MAKWYIFTHALSSGKAPNPQHDAGMSPHLRLDFPDRYMILSRCIII
jgi:hypothetical protein